MTDAAAKTLIDAIDASLIQALRSPDGVAPPAALLWTDADGQWAPLIPTLQKALPHLYVLGAFAPEERSGPVIWLRCIVERTLPEVSPPEGVVPILYLPKISRQDLRAAGDCPAHLQALIELQYRGAVWHQRNGRDWTVEAFLTSDDALGLDIARDNRTRDAMLRALPLLATEPVRLTLNVLLSFAQFEREVTAERIRDKIAASKKKGMWMGGAVPVGYENRDKKLVVSPDAAEMIRAIYNRYLELGSVRRLKEELDERAKSGVALGMETNTDPRKFSRGHLYWLLSNPVYAGDIRHKYQIMPGQHEAIVDRDLWEAVQQKLKGQARQRTSATNLASGSLLAGLLFDETGDRLTPSQAIKDGRRYSYYISQRLMQARKKAPSGWRLPAYELEMAVMSSLSGMLEDQGRLHRFLDLQDSGIELIGTVKTNAMLLARALAGSSTEARAVLLNLVARIDIATGEMRITFSPGGLHRELGIPGKAGERESQSSESSGGPVLSLPFDIRRRGVEARLIVGGVPQRSAKVDAGLVDAIGRARRWLHQLNTEGHPTIASLARHVGADDGEISRTLPLAFLAPDIVESIVGGRQPVELTVRKLIRLKPIPALWADQRLALGFPAI